MPTETQIISRLTLTSAQRRRVLGAVARVVRRTFGYAAPPALPRYPDAIPDIDAHIEQLVRVVRANAPNARAAQIVKHSCLACPHQFPSRYCPLRPRGGCMLYRCAESIAQAVAIALDEFEREEVGFLGT